MPKSEVKVSELVSVIGGELHGDPDLVIDKFTSFEKACPGDAVFVSKRINLKKIYDSPATLLVINQDQQEKQRIINSRASQGLTTVVYIDSYLFFIRATAHINMTNESHNDNEIFIHPTAVVDKSVVLKQGVKIGAGCIIEAGASIGEFSNINALTFIGKKCLIGSYCYFHPRSTILSNVIIGDNVILHSGCVIGSDGFGFVSNEDKCWEKVPQNGFVTICDNVEIGANTTIDKGTFNSTTIKSGAKLDNQVHIAHNVIIGKDTVIAGCVGIAGSTEIGENCQIGGAAGILGHLKICDKTIIGPKSLVLSNIDVPGKYVGVYPLQTDREWKRSISIVKKLDSLRKKLFIAKN